MGRHHASEWTPEKGAVSVHILADSGQAFCLNADDAIEALEMATRQIDPKAVTTPKKKAPKSATQASTKPKSSEPAGRHVDLRGRTAKPSRACAVETMAKIDAMHAIDAGSSRSLSPSTMT